MSISPTTSRPSTPSRPASRKCSLAIESPTTDCTGNNPLKAFLIYSNDNDHNSNNKSISSRSSSSSSSTNSHSHSSHANDSDVTNLQPESNIETSIRLSTDDDKTSKKGPFPQNLQLQHHYAASRSISSHSDFNDFKNFKNFNDFNNCSNTTKKKNNTHNIKRPQLAKCASVPSFKYDHLFDNNNYYYHNQPHFHYGNRRISICDLDNFSEEIDLYKDNCSFMERERENNNNNNNNNKNRNKQENETRNSHARLVDDNWPNMYELDTALNDHTEYYYKDNDDTSRRNSVKSDSNTLKMDSNTPKQLHHDFHSRNHRRRKSIALKFEEPKIL